MQNQKRIDTYTVFQSTRPSQGETHGTRIGAFFLSISIHSPLAGRDERKLSRSAGGNDFNPLAPRGARPWESRQRIITKSFQSTRPSRGETTSTTARLAFTAYFNPLAPRGARHALYAEQHFYQTFQSTRPSRGETILESAISQRKHISIHSPLAGRDIMGHREVCGWREISIHSPLAGRDAIPVFNSIITRISIHSPLAGRDVYTAAFRAVCYIQFQSTRPSRGETPR